MQNQEIYHSSNLRKHRRMEGHGIFFVTKCLQPRKPILTNSSETASIMVKSFSNEVDMGRLRIAAFCIMPDHWHILCSPATPGKEVRQQGLAPTFGLAHVMRRLNSWISKQTNPFLRQHSCAWQKSYYETKVRSGKQFRYICHYIENNPIRAELTDNMDEWPWSSAYRDNQSWIERPWQTPII